MIYMGGLTFDPNLVAAKRFGLALLERHGLYASMKDALYDLAATGSPISVLKGYCSLMRQRDVVGDALAKSEENHRDSLWITILENPAIQPKAEYEVRRVRSLLTLRITNVKLTYLVDQYTRLCGSAYNRRR